MFDKIIAKAIFWAPDIAMFAFDAILGFAVVIGARHFIGPGWFH